jgi:ABC-type glycerol-3-phosphate transport system substrate-binding protein
LRCAIAVLSVVAFALAGCGSGGGGSAAQSNQTLTIWMMTGGPVIQDVNKEFATKHPDMKVDIQIQQWDNIVTKLTTALATSKPPDIVEMGNTQNPLQTFAGGLAELTDVKSSFEDSANWLSGLASPSENGGKLYAVPLYGGTIATQTGGKWTATMSDPKNIHGLQAWQKFQNGCSTKSSVGVNTTNPDQNQLFADGKATMTYVKAWEPASVLQKNPSLKDKIGFFAMPGYTADKTLPVIVSGSTIGIATNSPHQAAAKDWLRIVTSKNFQQKMAQKLNLLPIAPGFTPSTDVTDQLKVAAQASQLSSPLPNSPGEATLEIERYNEQFFSKIAGNTDITGAASEYDKHATDAFNALHG